MEHLGSVDVYVKLAGKNVTTNFCLEDSETLDFVYDHIDRLNARLEALGILMPQVTAQLEAEGVKAFADAFRVLLDAVEDRRRA